jgi:hypothetical protein
MNFWAEYKNWDKLTPPFRVDKNLLNQYKNLIGNPSIIATLGCTNEFLQICDYVIAYDSCRQKVEDFPGCAIETDWRDLDFPRRNYVGAILGDNSLTCVKFHKEWMNVIERCKFGCDGPIVIKVFERPEKDKHISQIKEEVVTGKIMSFDCLRLELLFYLAHENTNVKIHDAYILFNSFFKKDELIDSTGWDLESINVIENYRNSDLVYAMPSQSEIVTIFPNVKRVDTTGFPMSENCPFYIF